MVNINKDIENIKKGDARNDSDEVVKLELSKTLDKVVPVRLSSEAWSILRKEAKLLGIGPTTLARMWIFERLNAHNNYLNMNKPDAKFEINKDKAGEFRFNLIALNGEIIAVSEGYKNKDGVLNGIDSVRRNASEAVIDDNTT